VNGEVPMTQGQSRDGSEVMFGMFGCTHTIFGIVWICAGIYQVRERAAARNWVPTPCTVLTSRFVDTQSRKTSFLEFSFSYHFGGQEFVSKRYSVIEGSYEWGVAAARAHPLGQNATCFVNPADPSTAVIDREENAPLFGWLPRLVFLVVGVFLLFRAFKPHRHLRPHYPHPNLF
jgi:hypothetical protein